MKIGSNIGFDRQSQLRGDLRWHEAREDHSNTRFMILVDLKPVISSNQDRSQSSIRWFSRDEIDGLGLGTKPFMFIGINSEDHGRYLISLSESLDDIEGVPQPQVDVRSLADQGVMGALDLSLAGMARALAAWHNSHGFCGQCGTATTIADSGWQRLCPNCGIEHYPRMDPVVIMLITHGDKCLLARDVRFPETLYSTLAGFLEPGEDIESAVRREVFEEVGLELGVVDYKFSQPWPFPYSLMLGCRAEAKSMDLTLDDREIADAFWVDKAQLTALLDGEQAGKIDLPKDFAIANQLMQEFIENL